MNNKLEKFIHRNRDDFDDARPSDNVWTSIEGSLPARKKEKRFTITDIYKWSAAAAVFFIALTSVYFLLLRKYSHESPAVQSQPQAAPAIEKMSSISAEYAAAFREATEAVESRQQQLRSAMSSDPVLYGKFRQDLNALDSSYRLLREQAGQSVNPDVIIRAIIQNLQMQSELLSRQLMIINEFKTTKTLKDETNI